MKLWGRPSPSYALQLLRMHVTTRPTWTWYLNRASHRTEYRKDCGEERQELLWEQWSTETTGEDSAYRALKGSAKVCCLPGLCVLAQSPAETRLDQQISSSNWLCLIYLDGSINNAGTTGTLSVLRAHLTAREPLPYMVLQSTSAADACTQAKGSKERINFAEVAVAEQGWS